MRKVTIYSMRDNNKNDDYTAVVAMLRSQRIKYDEVVDQRTTLLMGRGKFNPMSHGFVVILPNEQKVHDCIEVAMWISQERLKMTA